MTASPAPAPAAPVALPDYWPRARRELSRRCPVLAGIIAQHPKVQLVSRGDPFATLARSIVGQQISVKAADAVWARLLAKVPAMTPQAMLRRRASTLRAAGLSERKADYLHDLARHFLRDQIDGEHLKRLDDEEIIELLTAVRGIGRWTAEMFLIFNLLRPNVLPLDDLGLLKAIGLHYLDGAPAAELTRREGRAQVEAIAAAWAPWRTVATWYLWRSLDPVPVEY